MMENKDLSSGADLSSNDSDSDDDLFAYLNTKVEGKAKQDKPVPVAEYVDLEKSPVETPTSHTIEFDGNKIKSTDNGTKSKSSNMNLGNKSCIETQTPYDTDFDVYERRFWQNGTAMDVSITYNKNRTVEHEISNECYSTKSEVIKKDKPSESAVDIKSNGKNNAKSRKYQRKKKENKTRNVAQSFNENDESKKISNDNINCDISNRTNLNSVTAEMATESWSPSHKEHQKESITDKVNKYLASFKTFDQFKLQEQHMTESDWEKRMMSRDSESESMFSSPMKIEVSLIEQDVTPIHSPVSSVKLDGQNVPDENQAFIPNLGEGNRPLQFKFVRDGNKLKRIAVQESDPVTDILVDGIYHQAYINNIEDNAVNLQKESVVNEGRNYSIETNDTGEEVRLTGAEMNHDFEDVRKEKECETNPKRSDVVEKSMIVKTLVTERNVCSVEVTEAERHDANEDMNDVDDEIDVETIENEDSNVKSEPEQNTACVNPQKTTDNVGEIEIHDSGVSIDSDRLSTEDGYLYATLYKGATQIDSQGQNVYSDPQVTDYGSMNNTINGSSFGNVSKDLEASLVDKTSKDYFTEKYQIDPDNGFENLQEGITNNTTSQIESNNNSEIIKKTETDFVQYLENTCLSESASNTSQVSVCSQESPIVLKLGADGKLTECKKCPASHGWQEKKTEMDISFLAMRIQKIENDLSEMRKNSLSETLGNTETVTSVLGNTGTVTNFLNEATSIRKLEFNEDNCDDKDMGHLENNAVSCIQEEKNLESVQTRETKNKGHKLNIDTNEQSNRVNIDVGNTSQKTKASAKAKVRHSSKSNRVKENTSLILPNQAKERENSQSDSKKEKSENKQRSQVKSTYKHNELKKSEIDKTIEPSQEPKAFEILESLNISNSSFASSSTDDSSQEDLSEYMVLDEEHLQTMFLQKLAEVKQIQSALKRKNKNKSKSVKSVSKTAICSKDSQVNEKNISADFEERRVTRKSVCKSAPEMVSDDTKSLSSDTENSSVCETFDRKQTRSNRTSVAQNSTKVKIETSSPNVQQSSRSSKNLKRTQDIVVYKKAKVKKKVTWNENENNLKDNLCNTEPKQNEKDYKSLEVRNETDKHSKLSPKKSKASVSRKSKSKNLDTICDSYKESYGVSMEKIIKHTTKDKTPPFSSKGFNEISPQKLDKKRKLSVDHGHAKDSQTLNSTDKHQRKSALQAQTRIVEALENNQDIIKCTQEMNMAETIQTYTSPKTELEKLASQVAFKRKKISEQRGTLNKIKEKVDASVQGQGSISESHSLNLLNSGTEHDLGLSVQSPNKSHDVETKRLRLETIISKKLKSPQDFNSATSQEQNNVVSKDTKLSIKQCTPTSKVDKKIGSTNSKQGSKLENPAKEKCSNPVQNKTLKRGSEKMNEKVTKIKPKFVSDKSSDSDTRGNPVKVKRTRKVSQKYGSKRTFRNRRRLAKSYDETWKDKLDSNAFSNEVLNVNDSVRKPLNIKRLLKKILVSSDSSNTESSTEDRKHRKRRRDKRSSHKSSSIKVFKSSVSDVTSSKGGPVSFPGMSLGESASHPIAENLVIRKDQNQLVRENVHVESLNELNSLKGQDMECSYPTETGNKGIYPRLENLNVVKTSEKEVVTTSSVSESELTEVQVDVEKTEQESLSTESRSMNENKIPAVDTKKSVVTENHSSSSPTQQQNTQTNVNDDSSPPEFERYVLNTLKTSPHKSTFQQFKSLMDRRKNLFGKNN